MKILYVATDADIGGAERLLLTLARHRDERDEVNLLVLLGRGTLSAELDEAFDRVEYLNFPPTSRNLLSMVAAVDRVVRRDRPDIVASHLFHADLVVALSPRRSKRVTTVHTHGFGDQDHPLTKLIAKAVGRLSRRFDAVIPTSDSREMAEFLRRNHYRNTVSAIRNSSDIPEAPLFSAANRRFITLARAHPVKGYATLFEAFASVADRIPDWKLGCHGPGVDTDNTVISQALETSGARALLDSGRIELRGPTSDPQQELATAGALVIASHYGETFPLVGVEAAGAGVPVIASDVGNCRDFVDEPAHLVPPADAAALAEALLHYATLPDQERLRLSRLARARAEAEYSPALMADRYRAVYTGLLGG